MLPAEVTIIRDLVRPILRQPFDNGRKWQVQGLGMLRTYLSPETRLHIWCPEFNYCEDSGWHTHPWDFSSFVVAGIIQNTKYIERKAAGRSKGWIPFIKQRIICGPGGCSMGEPEDVFLKEVVNHTYVSGTHYSQNADEIHSSHPERGTVTVITRNVVYPDGSATVYHPKDSKRTSAEARPATAHEIRFGTAIALERMK